MTFRTYYPISLATDESTYLEAHDTFPTHDGEEGSVTVIQTEDELAAIRAKQTTKLIAAVAVAPPQILRRIAQEADEVVCLETPEECWAVGQCFDDFSQVSDEEVIAILQQSRSSLASEVS